MKNPNFRRALAGLIGSTLAFGGLAAPFALPHVAADDDESVVLIVDDTDNTNTDTAPAPEPDVEDFVPIEPSGGTIPLAEDVTGTTGQQGVNKAAASDVDLPTLTVADPSFATITTKQEAVFENVFDYDPLYDPESDDSLAGCSADVLPNSYGSGWKFDWGQFTFHSTTSGKYTATITCQDDIGQQTESVINTITVVGLPTLTPAIPSSATVLTGQSVEFDNTFTVDTANGASSNGCTINPAVSGASVDDSGKVTFGATSPGYFDIVFTCTDSMDQTTSPVTNSVLVNMGGLVLTLTDVTLSGNPAQPMPDDEATWTYTLENTNDFDVVSLSVHGDTCADNPLAAGATTTCLVTTTLTQADIDAGVATFSVQATGTNGGEPVYSNTVSRELQLEQVSDVTTTKTYDLADANGNGTGDPGEVVTFTIIAHNTGNVTLHDVIVIDSWDALELTCDTTGVLVADAMMTCEATYEVTLADVLAGTSLTNAAHTMALDASGNSVTSEPSKAIVPLSLPAAPVLKDVTITDPQPQGTQVDIYVKAEGYWDPLATYTPTVTVSGGSNVGTASLDVNNGWLTFLPNTAFTGQVSIEFTITDQAGQSASATAMLRIAGVPTLSANKLDMTVLVGDTVQFTNQLSVDTTNGAQPAGCRISPAVSGATVDDQGVVSFVTSTSGDYSITLTCSDSVGQTTKPVTLTVTVNQASLGLIVSVAQTTGDKTSPHPGDEITWTYQVTNTGQAPISALTVTPGLAGVGTVTCIDDALGAGQATVCTATSLLTKTELDAQVVRDTGAQAFGMAASDVEPRQISSVLVGASFDLPHPADIGTTDTDNAQTGGHVFTVVPLVLLAIILLGLGTWLILRLRRRMSQTQSET